MNVEELRIGNWVEYKGHHVIWDVSDFADSTAKRLSQPIPLTEEWLLKFGFFQDDYGPGYWNLPGFWWKLSDTKGAGFNVFVSYNNWFVCTLTYAHQLQNLYFALTGKELKLTPPTA